MINDKILKLSNELNTAAVMLTIASERDKTVHEVKEKIEIISLKLEDVICSIEHGKAIDNCRVRQLEMSDEGTGDCGTDENGLCLGYKDDEGMFEQCRVCEYSIICEEE